MASVYYGTAVVTVPDDSYQLKDILDALQLTSGIIRRRGGDAQVVATMPFETLPSFEADDEYEVVAAAAQGGSLTAGDASASSTAAVTMLEQMVGGGGAADADMLRALLLASSGSPPTTTDAEGSAGLSDDASSYISTVSSSMYVPALFANASHSVYAPSVYSPTRAATVGLQERLRGGSSHGYFATVDRYRPSGGMTAVIRPTS